VVVVKEAVGSSSVCSVSNSSGSKRRSRVSSSSGSMPLDTDKGCIMWLSLLPISNLVFITSDFTQTAMSACAPTAPASQSAARCA